MDKIRGGIKGPQLGTTIEELKPSQKEILPIEVTPLPPSELMRTLQPPQVPPLAGVPEPQNPFAGPYGPQLDYMAIRKVIDREKGSSNDQLVEDIQKLSGSYSKERLEWMQGALHLERKMVEKLNDISSMMSDVRNKMAATREG